MENSVGEKKAAEIWAKYVFKKRLLQRFALFCWNGPAEFVSQHRGKTRWSQMQRDIRAGNWLIGENWICEPCFVLGRGSQPSAMGLPQSQLTGCCLWSFLGCKHYCFQKKHIMLLFRELCPVQSWQLFGSEVVHVWIFTGWKTIMPFSWQMQKVATGTRHPWRENLY